LKEEQKQIGLLFEKLQSLILLHQLRFERLLNLRRALLDKIYPVDKALVPEIRFRGFTKDWKKIPFDDAFDLSVSTNCFSRSMLSDNGGIVKNIHYGDILTKYGASLDVFNKSIPYAISGSIIDYKTQLLKDGDIILADTAEDYIVGKATEIINASKAPIVAGLHTIVCRPRIKMQPFYLGNYMNSNSYRNSLLPLVQGTKVLSISKNSLSKTFIKYAESEDEQARIGMYFLKIDKLISFHQTLKDKFVNTYKACFEKMAST
jgi:type I restriction enzyme S subunit